MKTLDKIKQFINAVKPYCTKENAQLAYMVSVLLAACICIINIIMMMWIVISLFVADPGPDTGKCFVNSFYCFCVCGSYVAFGCIFKCIRYMFKELLNNNRNHE